jgi:alkylation response protein AidB-like acyl-CoA dehydrogenase
MNLTEPQAGSDVGRIRTKAEKNGDHYKLTGQKIFITYGEQDWTDNIVHFVLARLSDAPEGTRGLSLFLVPKVLVGEDGSPGPRNDLRCVSLEKKLGIHASPTCVMSYGDNGGAVGYLVGEENRGLEGMFVMMNYTRLSVGLQGVSAGERAYQQALAYAHERVQGRGANGAETSIIAHPDVKRMILTVKAKTEAGRALAFYAARCLDASNRHPDEDERARNLTRVGLLTPIVKAWCSENGVETASLNIQVHGGAGFIEETGAAQLFRDSRIAAIYEGTNGIQAADLAGRKVARDGGAAAKALIAEMTELDAALGTRAENAFISMRRHLGDGLVALTDATDWLVETSRTDPQRVAAGAVHYLRMFGAVCAGWLMAKSALIAAKKLASGEGDPAFHEAKIATARFFAEQELVDVPGNAAKFIAGADPVLDFADEI